VKLDPDVELMWMILYRALNLDFVGKPVNLYPVYTYIKGCLYESCMKVHGSGSCIQGCGFGFSIHYIDCGSGFRAAVDLDPINRAMDMDPLRRAVNLDPVSK